ncbi:MAG: nucleotide sugar dehydrogenase, partial [Candidatus Nealsonbacteria bacterium]
GLGYIGLPLTAALASVGYKVIGIDIDENKVKKLNLSYKSSLYEPGLNETLKRCKNRISFTTDQSVALKQCDAVIITVGTPIDSKGRPDFRDVDNVTKTIGKNIKKGQLIMLKSTVLPGITRRLALQVEKMSGFKAGKDFYVVYCPERTLEGKVLKELYTLPKIIGGINEESLNEGSALIKKLGGKVVKVSSLEIAEICKCIDNSYRVVNITFANEIGDICEKNGLDSYEIVSAVNKTYPRTNLFLPGLGAGGPCLSKDPRILNYYAKTNKLKTKMINASIAKSDESTMRLAPLITKFINKNKIKNPKIALVGLAFKGSPATDDIRNSPAVDIYKILQNKFKNASFSFCDPIIKEFFFNKVNKNMQECLKGSNVAVFLTNHPNLKNIDPKRFLGISKRPLLVVDCWHNLVNHSEIKDKNVQIFRIGDSSHLKI